MPWNPALWWIVRRLRLAIETDCDRRVLHAGTDVHAYGVLLLNAAARYARAPLLAGTAFALPPGDVLPATIIVAWGQMKR